MRNFWKFWPWPTFSSFTKIRWQATVRSLWWTLVENQLNGVVSEIFNYFGFFQVTHFPPIKWKLNCVTFMPHTFFINLDYLDHNPEKICLSWSDYIRGKSDKLVLSSAYRIGDPFGICRLSIAVCEICSYIEILTFQNSWPWKCRSRSWCTSFSVASVDGKYMTSYPIAIVMVALTLTVCEIFAKQEKIQNFDLENEGQVQGVEKRDLRNSTRNGRINIGFFSEL